VLVGGSCEDALAKAVHAVEMGSQLSEVEISSRPRLF
jgi:hypothetical protein